MSKLIDMFLQSSPMLQSGFALMVAGWVGYQLRELPRRLFEWVRWWLTRVVVIREGHSLYNEWLELLTNNAVRAGGPRTLEVHRTPNPEADGAPPMWLAAGLDTFWARFLGRWCRVQIHREHRPGSRGESEPRSVITVEVVLASRATVERMIGEVALRADVAKASQIVELYDEYGSATTIMLPKRHARTLCLPEGLFESIESRLREFCASRERYEAVGLPWRCGVLLSGPPGTGKTSLAHTLASHLGLRLAVINLADLEGDQELVTVFRSITRQSILLIEDVDCAFMKRKGDSSEGITFSGFLNCIDGVLAPNNGRILVMSTNHPERLDPALVRPGRVDLNIQVPFLERQDASDYVDRVFPHVAERHDIVNEIMSRERPTPAALINRLMQHHVGVGKHLPTPRAARTGVAIEGALP